MTAPALYTPSTFVYTKSAYSTGCKGDIVGRTCMADRACAHISGMQSYTHARFAPTTGLHPSIHTHRHLHHALPHINTNLKTPSYDFDPSPYFMKDTSLEISTRSSTHEHRCLEQDTGPRFPAKVPSNIIHIELAHGKRTRLACFINKDHIRTHSIPWTHTSTGTCTCYYI